MPFQEIEGIGSVGLEGCHTHVAGAFQAFIPAAGQLHLSLILTPQNVTRLDANLCPTHDDLEQQHRLCTQIVDRSN